ncbi:MAG: PDDEXK nuclease domain-containing protein [Lachnospiraceae bacterium]
MKCFVLIDFKNVENYTHQDVGQMDMYIRMYDEMKRNEGDNPDIRVLFYVLIQTKIIAKYSYIARARTIICI